jgi:DNA-binding CsgD family transcriptional regulator
MLDYASTPAPAARMPVMSEAQRSALRHTQPAATPGLSHPRPGEGELSQWLVRMLDEIDYGMLLVGSDAQVLYLNHTARHELDGEHPLQMLGRTLRAARPQDVAPLFDALSAAQRGLRKLITVGEGAHRVGVSVVPLPESRLAREPGHAVLLVLGKRQMCEWLTVTGWARSVGLTDAETIVLQLLCNGVKPDAIAQRRGVAVCTVRTQIGSIRAKTGTGSIAELVRHVALLPPLVGALRAALVGGSGSPVTGAS